LNFDDYNSAAELEVCFYFSLSSASIFRLSRLLMHKGDKMDKISA